MFKAHVGADVFILCSNFKQERKYFAKEQCVRSSVSYRTNSSVGKVHKIVIPDRQITIKLRTMKLTVGRETFKTILLKIAQVENFLTVRGVMK